MFKFGHPHHIYFFIFFSISFSLPTYFTISFLVRWLYILWREASTSTKYFVINFYTVPSKRVGDVLKNQALLRITGAVRRHYAGSQAASYKSRKTEASRNSTRELGGKEGPGRNPVALLLFVKAEYSLGSNLWLTPSFTHSVATTELHYRIYYKPLAPWTADGVWKSQQCLTGTSHHSFTRSGRLQPSSGVCSVSNPSARSCPGRSQHTD